MKTTTAILLGVSLVFSAAVFGNFFYRSRTHENTIRVVGSATKSYESDVVKWRITIGHNTGAGDMSSGYALTQSSFEALVQQLKASGFDEKDVSVQPINRNPTYDNQGQLNGYAFTQNIFVVSTDLSKVERLALNPDVVFQRNAALESSSLDYYFSKLPDIKKELLAEATADARNRALEIARNSGVRLGNLQSARSGVFQITEPYSTEVTDYGIYSTTTRQKDVTVTVTAEFGLR